MGRPHNESRVSSRLTRGEGDRRVTRWWKCDLQVATPGETRFRGAATWDLGTEAGRAAAADEYMDRAQKAGLEVLVLADHNSVEWVDEMVAAGKRRGIVVFPGFEVTTASGSDGAHLIIMADPEGKTQELGELLISACGFDFENPRFNPSQPDTPASSPRTLPQILDALDDRFLAIAPHAFTDNGIASGDTLKGDLRWKALHHDRLAAIDVGNISALLEGDLSPKASFRERFVRRELEHLPAIKRLPFVSTSDAYSLDELGTRYTWIRMESPSLEALRQAFLDYEARVICDWDPRYLGTGKTPNDISHAWVKQVTLTGAKSTQVPLEIEFDPRLTVLIGGRGAGKSTVVAALRHLYGDISALPAQARLEAEQLRDAVFSGAVLTSTHVLPYSGEEQSASWTLSAASQTVRGDGRETPTEFAVRVISQKELFERAAVSADGADSSSRNLLKLVDDALAASGHLALARFSNQMDELRTKWVSSARKAQTERDAIATRTSIFEAEQELGRQVAAFDDEQNKTRRAANDLADREATWMDAFHARLITALEDVMFNVEGELGITEPDLPAETLDFSDDLKEHVRKLLAVQRQAKSDLDKAVERGLTEVTRIKDELQQSGWPARIAASRKDSALYLAELAEIGLDPTAYEAVRRSWVAKQTELADIDRRARELPEVEAQVARDWAAFHALIEQRYADRSALLNEVSRRSAMLRFDTRRKADVGSWVESVRVLLNLRSDGFLEDVPELGKWLWGGDAAEQALRFQTWQKACITGDFSEVAARAALRATWVQRLTNLDPLMRVRLAAEIADDAVDMEFLRYGDPILGTERWEPLMTGSPGQRSAAMLSFVLHQGSEPLVLDQPEDDLDTEWISELVVRQLRASRWTRQVIVVTHNANIPVNADAERVVVLENKSDAIHVRTSQSETGMPIEHVGALENELVRSDIQRIMEGGVEAFVRRERRYNNEVNSYRLAMQAIAEEQAPVS
ncbi:TrlF family AAA-like ATPase [Leifsonia sp. NPDC014704]|uniref:TrlF family AAA-like ATPase n=1 Tax=Leifsonia sp. NPDC014704 TaxID=3364123 RepID=UPI0036F48765